MNQLRVLLGRARAMTDELEDIIGRIDADIQSANFKEYDHDSFGADLEAALANMQPMPTFSSSSIQVVDGGLANEPTAEPEPENLAETVEEFVADSSDLATAMENLEMSELPEDAPFSQADIDAGIAAENEFVPDSSDLADAMEGLDFSGNEPESEAEAIPEPEFVADTIDLSDALAELNQVQEEESAMVDQSAIDALLNPPIVEEPIAESEPEIVAVDQDAIDALLKPEEHAQVVEAEAEPEIVEADQNDIDALLAQAEQDAVPVEETEEPTFAPGMQMDDDELAKMLEEARVQKENEPSPVDAISLNHLEGEDVPADLTESTIGETESAAVAVAVAAPAKLDHALISMVPANLMLAAMAVPVSSGEGTFKILAAEPIDATAIERIEKATGLKVEAQGAPMSQVIPQIRAAYGSNMRPF